MSVRILFALMIGSMAWQASQAGPASMSYPAKDGPGRGRHVVFLTGDEEYRGE